VPFCYALRPIIDCLPRKEEVTRTRKKELGLSGRGAIVMKVVEGGQPMSRPQSDVVVSFNGRRVDSVRELQRLLGERRPTEHLDRSDSGGNRQTLNVTSERRSVNFNYCAGAC
jgi:S1-C subfamily serine protease